MSRAATARLFAALDLPLEVREALSEWARAAAGLLRGSAPDGSAGLRLLDVESLHLTLCFLGTRPAQEIDALAAVLPECAAHACELVLGAPVWLPERRPHALAVEAHEDPEGELAELARELSGAFARVSSWQPERRRLRAHVTVARVRGARGRGGRRGEGRAGYGTPPSLAPTPRLAFAAETLSLYRSWLRPSGAVYERVAGCALLPASG